MIKIFFLFLSFFCLNLSAMIIDNLNDVRAKWSAISDQVMGGISEVNFYEIEETGEKFYRLEGDVSTENNGGFIQSRVGVYLNSNDFKIQTRKIFNGIKKDSEQIDKDERSFDNQIKNRKKNLDDSKKNINGVITSLISNADLADDLLDIDDDNFLIE